MMKCAFAQPLGMFHTRIRTKDLAGVESKRFVIQRRHKWKEH